jgi:hypothetical protein
VRNYRIQWNFFTVFVFTSIAEQSGLFVVNLSMETLLGIVVIGLAVFGLAAGTMFGGRRLNSSCSGTSGECETCRGNPDDCKNASLFS